MSINPNYMTRARDFIVGAMRKELPGANVDEGSAIHSLIARGAAAVTASLMQEIDHLMASRDLSSPDQLSEADVDLLLANLMTKRPGGEKSAGFVNLYYRDRGRRDFPAGTGAVTVDGELVYKTLADLVYLPEDYALDGARGLYYLSVPFVAEVEGESYNIDPGQISKIVDDYSSPVFVTNPSPIRGGAEKQTNAQVVSRAKRAVSTRTPLTRDGVVYWLGELFGVKLRDVLVVGNGDAEMARDELWDMGQGQSPRYQIGVDSLDPVTRAQLGEAQGVHVGGRTDVYMLMENMSYVQQHIDIFSDMTLDADISVPGAVTQIQATFVAGTTGQVPATGKMILDLGTESQETLSYSQATKVDNDTYVFSQLESPPTLTHAQDSSVKVVNNSELGVGSDITITPVIKIDEVRLLDPVTFAVVGDPIPETTTSSSTPGWFIDKTNVHDLMSARETKTLVIDEKSGPTAWPGNQALSASGGSLSDLVVSSTTYSLLEVPGTNFSGYQGRKIAVVYGAVITTRTILRVEQDQSRVLLSGPSTGSQSSVSCSIDAAYADYIDKPVRVSFYTTTELGEAQSFFDNDGKRVVAGDIQARAFWPVFIDFYMKYKGNGIDADVRKNINEVLKTSSGSAIGESVDINFDYSDLINAAYVDGLASYVQTPFEVRVRTLQDDGSWSVAYINPGPDTVNSLAVKTPPDVQVHTGTGGMVSGQSVLSDSAYTFTSTDVGRIVWVEGLGLAKVVAVAAQDAVLDAVSDTDSSSLAWSFTAQFIECTRPGSVAEFVIPDQGKLIFDDFGGGAETVDYVARSVSGADVVFVIAEGQGLGHEHGQGQALRVAKSDYSDAGVITDGVIASDRRHRPFLGQVVIENVS